LAVRVPGPSGHPRRFPSVLASGHAATVLPAATPYARTRAMSIRRRALSPPRPPIAQTQLARCRNVDLLSIDYALRPRLRTDYPWVDHPGPGTLGLSVAGILTPLSRYSYRHSLSSALHPRSRSGFSAADDAPLPLDSYVESAASAVGLSPVTFSAQGPWTSGLLRTRSRGAAFKPTSWLSSRSHILVH